MASSTMSVGSATSRLGLRARLASRSRAARVVARPRLFPARTNNGFLRATTRNLASSLDDGVIVTPFPQRPLLPHGLVERRGGVPNFPRPIRPGPRGPPRRRPPDDWGAPPTIRSFQGGSLRGITANLDHIQSLGVNCIYMTPVFLSTANHRYHPSDFMQVDPMYGGDAAASWWTRAIALRACAVRRRLQPHRTRTLGLHLPFGRPRTIPLQRLVLAKVLPRCGVRRGAIQRHIECWWDLPDLPKLNFANEGVRQHVLDVGAHWIREYDVDGWRLDYPIEIPPEFWRQFRDRCRAESPDAVTIGNSSEFAPSLWAGRALRLAHELCLRHVRRGFRRRRRGAPAGRRHRW